jgi:DNA-directed RNA polymerase subunit RPC12/RpoP
MKYINMTMKAEFEEVEFVCSNCGKKVKMIKRKGYSTEGLLCQKCGLSEEIGVDTD